MDSTERQIVTFARRSLNRILNDTLRSCRANYRVPGMKFTDRVWRDADPIGHRLYLDGREALAGLDGILDKAKP